MSYISDALTMDVIDECLHYLTTPCQLQRWRSLKPDGNIVMNEDGQSWLSLFAAYWELLVMTEDLTTD
jgi:hypothetical protein